jgi:GH35 family endo-1,4-beta-xylanase
MSRLSDIKYSPLLANTAWLIPDDNDGISSEVSHKWGMYMGLVGPAFVFDYATGIDAFQVINDFNSGQDFWSVNLFYLKLLNDLKNKGY